MLRTPWRGKKRSHSSVVGPSWQPTLGTPAVVLGAAPPRPLSSSGAARPPAKSRLRSKRARVIGRTLSRSLPGDGVDVRRACPGCAGGELHAHLGQRHGGARGHGDLDGVPLSRGQAAGGAPVSGPGPAAGRSL